MNDRRVNLSLHKYVHIVMFIVQMSLCWTKPESSDFFRGGVEEGLWTRRGSAKWGRTICLYAHYQTFFHTVSYKTRLDIIQTSSFISYYIWLCIRCWCLHMSQNSSTIFYQYIFYLCCCFYHDLYFACYLLSGNSSRSWCYSLIVTDVEYNLFYLISLT